MAIAILVGRDQAENKTYQWFIQEWCDSLLALQRDLDIRVWPNIHNPNEVEFALVWKHAFGELRQFPNIKAIASLAAGVDHVIADPQLSTEIPLSRVIDPFMASDIVQYVVSAVLQYVKRMDYWFDNQQQKNWAKEPPFSFSDKTIGVMGLGFLGGKAVNILQQLGLNVVGWSNSPKTIVNVQTFAGNAEFPDFLSQSHILICMLPLTKETQNILNEETFSKLPMGAYLINVGRGEHLVDADLLKALEAGQLTGAFLDVFRKEPLPTDHPFWNHPNIRITPHIASVTNAKTAARQIIENYHRAMLGQDLINRVDFSKGY